MMNRNNNSLHIMNTTVQHRGDGAARQKERPGYWLPSPVNYESQEQRWRRQGKLQ